MLQNEVENLKSQLTVARNEINKLRQQVVSLKHEQRKEIDEVSRILRDFRCKNCCQSVEENGANGNELAIKPNNLPGTAQASNAEETAVAQFRPIGLIRTVFSEKRGVPRQSSVGSRLRGMLELNSAVFTNPEHALENLTEYSHLWLIYHFHKNNSHPKAKVSPPRLGGERVGVFSTRSPHRPCPIGLSLVEIEKVEGSSISFFGTDMVDGTPVLDIKPYIPLYDAPMAVDSGRVSGAPANAADFYGPRQEPDGEESEFEMLGAMALNSSGNKGPAGDATCRGKNDSTETQLVNQIPPPSQVKVPNWVVANHHLEVCFNEHAEAQLRELKVDRQSIVSILEADPRSVYLRTRYSSQIFTFQLSEVTVTCKFDDKAARVTVVQIRRIENVHDDVVTEK